MGESDRPPRRATILIVEDDDSTALSVQDALTGAGYVVSRAASADAAIRTLESTPADLIITSLMLPDADGFILCSTLKARFRTPIIMLSARRGGEVDRALSLESGALGLLTTPVDVDELLAQVMTVVGLQTPSPSGRGRG